MAQISLTRDGPWRRPWLASVLLGTVVGGLCAYAPGALAVTGGSIALLAWVTRSDRDGLFRLALWALGLRWLLIVGITGFIAVTGRQYFIHGPLPAFALFGDDGYYTIKSWWLWQRLVGEYYAYDTLREVSQEAYGRSGHMIPMTLFYHLFGYSPTAVKGISALLSILTGLLMYDMTRHLAGYRAARWTCLVVWYWPSLVLWSVTNLKDPYVLFLTCVALWTFHRWLLAPRRVGYLVLAATALWAHATIKSYLWSFVVAAMLMTGFLHLHHRFRWRIALALVLLVVGYVGMRPHQVHQRLNAASQRIAMFHIGQARSEPNALNYRLLPEKFYLMHGTPEEFSQINTTHLMRMLLLGPLYVLIVPLPWDTVTLRQGAVIPLTLLWYSILIAAIRGFWWLVRMRWREASLLIGTMLFLTVAIGMTGGNVGTTFRHRDMVTPLYLMCAMIGLLHWRNPPTMETASS